MFGTPFPSPAQLAAYYDGFSFQQPDDEVLETVLAEVARATTSIVEDLVHRHGAKTGSLLEFGGGIGLYAAGFRNHFDRVMLYDVDPQACAYARKKFGGRIEVTCGSEDASFDDDATFDVVFSSHVIEHFVDLTSYFDMVTRRAKPGGLVVIATPNRMTWEYFARPQLLMYYLKQITGKNPMRIPRTLLQLAREPWLCCDPPRHIYAFDKNSLSGIAEAAGLIVEDVFTEYTFDARYARVSDLASERSKEKLRRASWVLLNSYAKPALRWMQMNDKAQHRGGNLVLIGRKRESQV